MADTDIDLPTLAALAEAATPEKWSVASWEYEGIWVIDPAGGIVAHVGDNIKNYEQKAAYIAAASPTTILALIRRVQEAEADRDRLRDRLDDSHRDFAELATSERKATAERDRLRVIEEHAGLLRDTLESISNAPARNVETIRSQLRLLARAYAEAVA